MVFVGTSCFGRVSFFGISIYNKFDKFFYDILTDLILLFLIFCFMTLFQDIYKLVKARFVWRVVGWRLNGFSLGVVFGILPAMFFKICSHIFHDFWNQIGVVILVTPKQEMERKSECFFGVNFFRSNFKVEWENGVWTKIRFLVVVFCSHAAISLWFLVFSIFWIGFFSKWFSQSIRSSF